MFNREYLIRYPVQIRAHDIRMSDQRVKYHARAGARPKENETWRGCSTHQATLIPPDQHTQYYPGKHVLEIQVNGERYGKLEFDLA